MKTKPTYFWSGSNCAGEIAALAKHGEAIGVSVGPRGLNGRGMTALDALAPAPRVVVNVAQSRGRPILMFNRERDGHSQLPQGDTAVQVDGRCFVFCFRMFAVYVARSTVVGSNIHEENLRGRFGENAGGRGPGHRVALELTRTGWEITDAEIETLKASGSQVFVDSGAFGEVRFDPQAGRMVDVRPITDADWHTRLDAYDRIAAALGSSCYLVAPDKVGDQAETLRRLARYAPRVRALRELGANVIVPLQRGELSGAEFDRECSRILGFSDYVRGIPSKKAAATVEEIAELSRSLPADARIHLLGLGPFGERYGKVIAAIDRAPALVFCDSVRIKALVGRTNGRGGGARILTVLTDKARAFLGLAPSVRLSPDESFAVKFRALDAYFSNHFDR